MRKKHEQKNLLTKGNRSVFQASDYSNPQSCFQGSPFIPQRKSKTNCRTRKPASFKWNGCQNSFALCGWDCIAPDIRGYEVTCHFFSLEVLPIYIHIRAELLYPAHNSNKTPGLFFLATQCKKDLQNFKTAQKELDMWPQRLNASLGGGMFRRGAFSNGVTLVSWREYSVEEWHVQWVGCQVQVGWWDIPGGLTLVLFFG